MAPAPQPGLSWRRRAHLIIDRGAGDDLSAKLVHGGLVTLIVVNIAALVLESVPSLAAAHGRAFYWIELVSAVLFTLEYAVRLWTAPEHARYRDLSDWAARRAYALSPPALLDFLATVPLYTALLGYGDLKILLLFRLLRFFKLGRYSPGMASLGAALHAERKALLACVVILIGAMLLSATAMHFVEHDIQPEKFGTIPDAMWWAIVTLTTVGYGDAFPISPLGKLVASLTAVMGLVMLALPVGIIATAFAQEIHRREFVVTWSMLARVPLFSGLNASEIAEIMHSLRARTVRGGSTVLRPHEPAHSLYFVASGEVEIIAADGSRQLDEGCFFGELVLGEIAPAEGGIAARATVATKLLILDPADFRLLMLRQPELAARLHQLAVT
ncbi:MULTISPECIES: cyclic nucleotide-gated ion channel [unclassified Bosea (in: a-proteobacteria)]|uniref:cyclic nucleotide-gated ion channel n=1 Tax=unclassified Bosea (in: a-proteobacteria) TaxID=2653178 RepID=UPI000F74CDF5|nr:MULTISPECIES: cyclic nucleotide-gated ion channel [unclassified Bosea (in: a-proteobacteria)]AZO76578.1 cyclic nucleotide-binding protein [Bosea sp. Tri-49]RXT21411.1 cyclic nucleotide-binding protein [Bosea sp. Tri-39]RXT31750.1 cyclic nucleotide-binding protein [Bosea sp. Tri-54]